MAQPQWITPAGSIGTIPEGVFYRVVLRAEAGPGENVYYQLIAGHLPQGIQLTSAGYVEGVPVNLVNLQGVPTEVDQDVTSKFAVRAYTVRVVNGVIVVDRLADRTFTITVAGQDAPEFTTPAGNIGRFYDGSKASVQLQYIDADTNDTLRFRLVDGELPTGMLLNPTTGLISGIILPLVGPPDTAPTGFSSTQYDQYPFDFSTISASKNYQFTIEISDGKANSVRTFEIYVTARNTLTADTTDITADNSYITADETPTRTPIILNPEGSIGMPRADNFYAYRFEAIDFDDAAVTFESTGTLPPGLTLNGTTGWLYGYIPDQGFTQYTYEFAVRAYQTADPTVISAYNYYSVTVQSAVDSEPLWITKPDLGTIDNGAISTLSVEAVEVEGRSLQYRLAPGLPSRLPQGLTLQSSGNITGRVSFNTFALDGGTTIFDSNTTTFDMTNVFTVNAYVPADDQAGYSVESIAVTDGGSGYNSLYPPTITISPPPDSPTAVTATAGSVTIVGGEITAIAITNPGRGYIAAPTITIASSIGSGATVTATIVESTPVNLVSIYRTFTVLVVRRFNQPYEKLYIKAMPSYADRALIDSLVQNQDAIPQDLVYRPDDPYFGVASSVIYDHAYGLNPASLDLYVSALDINHYWKNLTLGVIQTAQALDSNGNVLYEVIYSPVIDNLVNNAGESVSKAVTLPYPINEADSTEISIVYPNSLINMRDQVVSVVGQISPPLTPALPLWMTTKQANGRVLGFTPAWVIAYVKPGQSSRVAYYINQIFGENLNLIDFKVDRYELDRSATFAWDSADDQWIPQPPAATTFDLNTYTDVNWTNNSLAVVEWTNAYTNTVGWGNTEAGSGTIFDGGDTTFITPAPTVVTGDEFDKYLVFPRINILG
jgi:hypothetical protein